MLLGHLDDLQGPFARCFVTDPHVRSDGDSGDNESLFCLLEQVFRRPDAGVSAGELRRVATASSGSPAVAAIFAFELLRENCERHGARQLREPFPNNLRILIFDESHMFLFAKCSELIT